ncbi:MAG: discoidin domain-containing protein, partial [Pirellulaceae bacterium]
NETMVQPEYLDMLTRGLLWAVGKDVEKSFRTPDEATSKAIVALATAPVAGSGGAPVLAGKCCGEGNLAFGRQAQASSEETSKKNFARNAVDGDLRTRWCAAGSRKGETWQVDLEKSQHVKAVRIHWEKEATAYQYQVLASADGKDWKQIADHSKNKKKQRVVAHQVNAPGTRYLQIKFLGATGGMWGSFWEFEASDSKLPELPKGVTTAPAAAAATIGDVRAPAEFNVTMFGAPPQVNYPVCLAAAADGTVFVGVDEQGSLGKEPGRGKVLRCIDTDGDGVADEVNEFARMNHPRGLFFDNHSLWVLHPRYLSVFHDEDRDGKSDRQEILVKGITTDQLKKRGADHTTNGIRVGIDGWIYIAVGDFGFVNATAVDGTKLTQRGGGILRIRPNGKEMEVFSWGQRNILDVCIDPYMNVFTRDNTNDGGGWDIRVSHVIQSGLYGYPSLYKNFTDEMMPPLADYGGGSGCGGMFLHDLRWPEKFRNTVYTCDWGRSEVYSHNLPAAGATFAAQQDVFLKIPRPTDIDVDGSGRMYVASWKNGKFNYGGPNVGFVAQVVPRGYVPKPFPDLNAADDAALIGYLKHPSAVYRLHSQWELVRRGASAERIEGIMKVVEDQAAPLYGRVAALYTVTQIQPHIASRLMSIYTNDPAVREFILRAMTDRRSGPRTDPAALTTALTAALQDANPRVRAQALISLGRLGGVEAAEAILTLTARESQFETPTKTPLYNQPDPGRVIPHLAVRALVAVGGVEVCLKGLNGPYHDGAQWALKYMHRPDAVQGLIKVLSTQRDEARRRAT